MTDKPKGTFAPVHRVLPNPNEPDWDVPVELEFADDNSERLEKTPRHSQSLESDQVSSAFQTIRDVLERNIKALNENGAYHFKESNYAEAQRMAEQGQILFQLKLKSDQLHSEWLGVSKEIFLESNFRNEENVDAPKRRPQKRLLVSFPDGGRVFESSAVDTFLKSIEKIGISKVEDLGIKRLNHPLVSSDSSDKYNSTFINGYYILTHFSTDAKRKLLEEIGRRLSLPLEVTLIE